MFVPSEILISADGTVTLGEQWHQCITVSFNWYRWKVNVLEICIVFQIKMECRRRCNRACQSSIHPAGTLPIYAFSLPLDDVLAMWRKWTPQRSALRALNYFCHIYCSFALNPGPLIPRGEVAPVMKLGFAIKEIELFFLLIIIVNFFGLI